MKNFKKIGVIMGAVFSCVPLLGKITEPKPTGMEIRTNVVAPRVSAVMPMRTPIMTPSVDPVKLQAKKRTFERFVEVVTAIESLRLGASKLTQQIQTLEKQLKSADKQKQYLFALKILFTIIRPTLVKSAFLLSELTDVINSAQFVEDHFSPETRIKFFELSSMAKTGYQYVYLMDQTLDTLLAALKVRDDKQKEAAARAAELALQREELSQESDVDFDSLFALADIAQEEHNLIVQTVQKNVEDVVEADDSKVLQVLRVIDRLVKMNKGMVRKNIEDLAFEISIRKAKPEAQIDPALKLLLVACQPVADSCYILNAIIELLASVPIFGKPFEKVTSVTKQVSYHADAVYTALKELADSLQEQDVQARKQAMPMVEMEEEVMPEVAID